jgi:hypothetical protein
VKHEDVNHEDGRTHRGLTIVILSLLVAMYCLVGCDTPRRVCGTWSGVAEPIVLFDANRHPVNAVALAITASPPERSPSRMKWASEEIRKAALASARPVLIREKGGIESIADVPLGVPIAVDGETQELGYWVGDPPRLGALTRQAGQAPSRLGAIRVRAIRRITQDALTAPAD